jgi:hypothetical protein
MRPQTSPFFTPEQATPEVYLTTPLTWEVPQRVFGGAGPLSIIRFILHPTFINSFLGRELVRPTQVIPVFGFCICWLKTFASVLTTHANLPRRFCVTISIIQ